jgi:hypothetical protein
VVVGVPALGVAEVLDARVEKGAAGVIVSAVVPNDPVVPAGDADRELGGARGAVGVGEPVDVDAVGVEVLIGDLVADPDLEGAGRWLELEELGGGAEVEQDVGVDDDGGLGGGDGE